jgi:hypothetical protein
MCSATKILSRQKLHNYIYNYFLVFQLYNHIIGCCLCIKEEPVITSDNPMSLAQISFPKETCYYLTRLNTCAAILFCDTFKTHTPSGNSEIFIC